MLWIFYMTHVWSVLRLSLLLYNVIQDYTNILANQWHIYTLQTTYLSHWHTPIYLLLDLTTESIYAELDDITFWSRIESNMIHQVCSRHWFLLSYFFSSSNKNLFVIQIGPHARILGNEIQDIVFSSGITSSLGNPRNRKSFINHQLKPNNVPWQPISAKSSGSPSSCKISTWTSYFLLNYIATADLPYTFQQTHPSAKEPSILNLTATLFVKSFNKSYFISSLFPRSNN